MEETPKKSSTGLIVAGYIFSLLALVILPIPFGITGFIIGIVNLVRGSVGNGIAQIILSLICGFTGAIAGAIVGASMFAS